jgi:hypothetical protein
MIEQIKFLRQVEFLGRNGPGQQSGIDIATYNQGSSVIVAPITSKGMVGRCSVEIPVESIPDVILALTKFQKTVK